VKNFPYKKPILGPNSTLRRRFSTTPGTQTLGQTRTIAVEAIPSPRRGLNRAEAALYVGVSPSKFDEMVSDGRMCPPKRIDARTVWDIRQLDAAFECLPCDVNEAQNPWDDP